MEGVRVSCRVSVSQRINEHPKWNQPRNHSPPQNGGDKSARSPIEKKNTSHRPTTQLKQLRNLFTFISPEWIYPVAKETKNKKLNNLTINTNSQHVQHDEVGNVIMYTAKQSLAIECHIIRLPQLRDCMTHSSVICPLVQQKTMTFRLQKKRGLGVCYMTMQFGPSGCKLQRN